MVHISKHLNTAAIKKKKSDMPQWLDRHINIQSECTTDCNTENIFFYFIV